MREDGRAKQRIIKNLGRGDVVIAAGDLERLAASAGRYVERAVFATVLHRIMVSGSDRACEKWLADYDIRRLMVWRHTTSTVRWPGLVKNWPTNSKPMPLHSDRARSRT